MSQEIVLYENDGVLVTRQRAVLAGKTFAMANISSVSLETRVPNTLVAWLLVIGGVLLSPCAMGVTLVFSAVGVYFLVTGKPTHSVVITSASTEVQALTSHNEQFIQDVVHALNEAIVSRG